MKMRRGKNSLSLPKIVTKFARRLQKIAFRSPPHTIIQLFWGEKNPGFLPFSFYSSTLNFFPHLTNVPRKFEPAAYDKRFKTSNNYFGTCYYERFKRKSLLQWTPLNKPSRIQSSPLKRPSEKLPPRLIDHFSQFPNRDFQSNLLR